MPSSCVRALFRSFLVSFCLLLRSVAALGEGAYLVEQINNQPGPTFSFFPSDVFQAGAVTFLDADDHFHGGELFRTNGTQAGTTLVKDICPGLCSSFPRSLRDFGGIVVFIAFDMTFDASGHNLLRSDGTAAGTTPLTTFTEGPGATGEIAVAGSNIFFAAADPANGTELWRSDGTPGGTAIAANINSGSAGSDPSLLTAAGSTLFFFADDGSGVQLWKHDGVSATKVSTTVFTVGGEAKAAGGLFFFTADDGSGGQLWVSNGTTVTELTSFASGLPAFTWLTSVGASVFFIADDGTNGVELWKSNGIVAGTVIVQDINPTGDSSPRDLLDAGGTLSFVATDGTGQRFFTSDGTTTTPVTASGAVTDPAGNQSIGSDIIFADDPGSGWNLYKLSGSTVTQLSFVSGAFFSPTKLGSAGGRAYYSFDDGTHGEEPWVSDGTPGGTTVLNLAPETPSAVGGLFNADFVPVSGNRVIFSATDTTHGEEPWLSDGTVAGTDILRDLNGTSSHSFPEEYRVAGANVFFKANDGPGGELWFTNLTNAGTILPKDVNPSNNPLSPRSPGILGNKALFSANDGGGAGLELWISDGTNGGTTLLKDINVPAVPLADSDSQPFGFFTIGSQAFFGARTNDDAFELWVTDGTGPNTLQVKNIHPSASASGLDQTPWFADVGGKLYFVANDGSTGKELWTSDGTGPNTVRITDIAAGAADAKIQEITALGNLAVFRADDGTNGRELWVYDTISTTLTQIPICSGACDSFPHGFVLVGSTLYFAANDGVNGEELWKTDGTPGGTSMVADIFPGANSSAPFGMTNHNGVLYFDALTPAAGEELWKSDGTAPGTVLVADLEPGSGASRPFGFGSTANRVYFWADTTATGLQVFATACDPATHYNVVAPLNAVAGTPFNITVDPLDASNANDLCYNGTVHFTSTDPLATLPADYTFIPGEGAHTFSITLRTAGVQTITATDTVSAITGAANVTAAPGPPVASQSTLAVTGSPATANGVSAATATVQARDASGNNLTTGGAAVVINSSLGIVSGVTDNANGTYSATITSTVAGNGTVSGTLNGSPLANTAPVAFVAGPPSGATSTITAVPAQIAADGVSASTITVQLFDANGNPLTAGGATVVLQTTFGSLGAVTDNGNGTYTATFTGGTTPGTATITGTINAAPIADTATVNVTAGAPVASQSTLAVIGSPATANGVAAATATVQARDQLGNNLASGGAAVVISSAFGNVSGVTDNGDGTYTATITSTVAGNGTVSATLNGSPAGNTAPVAFVAGPPSVATSTIDAVPALILANGSSTSTITVRLFDANGNAVTTGGATVVLQTTLGSLGPVTDNGNGTYTATLTSGLTQGTAIISGTVNASPIADTASVAMFSDIPALSTLSLAFVAAALALIAMFVLRRF